MSKTILMLLMTLAYASSTFATSCQSTLIIGDSQLGWNMDPFLQSSSLNLEQLRRIPEKSLGFLIYESLIRNCPDQPHYLFAQGSSGVTDWMEEFQTTVPFLGGSRVILKPDFSFMAKRAAVDISPEEQSYLSIPSMRTLMKWYSPKRVLIALSANDWKKSSPEIINLYKSFLKSIRVLLKEDSDCLVQGVAGLDGRYTRSMRQPGDPIELTQENVQKLNRAVREAALSENCQFVDMTSVRPTALDGIHYQGDSAREAFLTILPDLIKTPMRENFSYSKVRIYAKEVQPSVKRDTF